MTPLKRAEEAILRVAKERGVVMGIVAANHIAIDVLTAIREPSDRQITRGRVDVYGDGNIDQAPAGDDVAAIYTAMIDAALAEEG